MKFTLEICVDSIESAINAQIAGAHRIELCDSLYEGGTTPSFGKIKTLSKMLKIGFNVLIRPRAGDFLYTDIEYEIIRKDIQTCGECGVDGIVCGILLPDGSIDVERTARLVELAYPMKVTFHRAFDMCNDPLKGLEDIIATGSARLLTSGMKENAIEGSDLIRQLVLQADGKLEVMPGSGINELNISEIARNTGSKEFHLSGRSVLESNMIYRKQGISMGGNNDLSEFTRKVADPEKIKRIINLLNAI